MTLLRLHWGSAADPKEPFGFLEKILVRVTISIAVALFVCACTSTAEVNDSERHAIVATVTEEGCDRPSVRIDGVTNTESGSKIALDNRFGPVQLQQGHYAISVACQNPLDEGANKCVFWGHPNEYPTYKMPLSEGVKYTFRCFVEGQEISYRILESIL